MKFTIVNNQPVKRVLPMAGSLTIEPYGILVINKSEKFRKSFENLSAYGYSVYCEKDITDLKNTGTIKSDFMKSDIPNNSSEDKLEIKEEESSPLGDKLKSIMGSKPKETEKEKPAIKDKSKESESKEEEEEKIDKIEKIDKDKIDKDELEIRIDNSSKEKLEIKEEKKETSKEVQEKETRESILNKCKSLPADTLRAILREIGITSTSNNTNTLFNKLSNSETNDESLILAYYKVVDKDV